MASDFTHWTILLAVEIIFQRTVQDFLLLDNIKNTVFYTRENDSVDKAFPGQNIQTDAQIPVTEGKER